jgi:hypothetical protein
MILLPINDIKDSIIRKAFELLTLFLNRKTILNGEWRFVEITTTGVVTAYSYKHSLSFVPKDVIQTSLTGSGSVTWLYSSFDETNVKITTTGACTVRAFIGRYSESN